MSAVTLVNSDVGINLNINGGYYNCDALMDGGNITVSGGVFTVSSLPSNAVVAEGKTLFDDAGGALQVFRDGVRYVCIVGDAHTCHDGKSLAPLPGGVNGELFGEFYLPADREFDGSITSPGWNTICLNGHKLKSSGSEAGTVNVTEGRLTVCDCSENEKGVLVANVKVAPKTEGKRSCTFNLQSGGIEGGIELSNGEALWSKFNMTGGRLGAVNTPVTVGQNGKAVISDGEIIGISNAVSVTSNGSAEITGGYFFNRDDGTPVFNGCNATGGYFYYKPADSDVAPGCEAMQLTTPIGIYKWRVMKVHEHPDGTKFTPLTQTSGDLAEGTYFLDKDIDLTGELNIGNNVTICLNGKTLTGGNYGIKVSNSAPVTICDCSEKQEGTITAAVQVSGGKLTLESGKIVTSDYIPGVQINSGTFDMKGGEVAAVSALGGSFNLSGGTVRYNGTGINSPIIIANSNTNITGGTVIAWRDKPVIVAKSGTVTISGGYFVTKEGTPFFEGCKATGGYFSHEPAPSDIATDYEAYDAGIEYEGRKYSHMIAPKDAHCHDGIVFAEGYRNGSSYYLTADSEIIRLTDGATYNICLGGKTVSEGIALVNNTAVNLYGCPLAQNPGSVGEVFVWKGTTLNLYGGSIGCVNVENGTFNLHGGAFDSSRNGNVLLQSGQLITIGEDFAPTPGTQISVKISGAVTPTVENPFQITGANTRDYSDYFVSADSSYRVINGANNVLHLVPRTDLTITANSASKTYDGAALTDNGFKVICNGTEYQSRSDNGVQTASFTIGETTYTVTATVSGSATNVSDTRTGNNTITAWSISDSNGVVQSSTSTGGNLPFAVSTAAGTLTITKAQRQLTITVKNQEYDYDGNAKGAPNDTITADFGKYVEVEGLATGDTLTSLTILGQMTDAGTYTGALVASNAAISSTNYNYTVQYVAGNLIINADETAPTGTITVSSEAWERFESWDSLQSEISFDKYSNKNYTVSIAANDSGSGVASFGYLTSNAEISDEELSKRTDWISYTDPFELTAEGKYIIYAKITDNSNNVTYISTRGLVLDKTAPAFEGIEKNSTYCCQVQFTVDDTTPVVVFVNGSAITADSQGVYTISTTTGGDYTVRAVDNAGNETQAQIRINSNHVYGDPNYTWDGFTSCLAEITCANCPWSDQEYGTITNAVTTQPTCTAAGERTYTATFSEAWAETRTKTESISALNHDLIFHAGQNPTCTVGGWFAYETCTHCDYSTYEAISPLGHEPVQHDGQAPTCTEVGWNEYFTCIRCSYSTYVEIPALGHNEETHVAKEATCTDVGWNEYVTCTRCDYSTYVEIPALGHNEETHDAQEPTCTDVGWNEYVTCTRCDYTTYSEIPALGHNEETHDAQEATCTEEGWNEYVTCTRCDYSTYVEIPALGHDEETHEAKVPTCTEIGWNEYDTCSRCDYTTYEEIAALGHSYGTEWTNEKDSHWHECSACGDKADAAKHTPKTVNAKEATRTEKGYTGDTVCETCGYEIAKGKVIPVISDPNNPQTGDNSHMALWIALMILSCGGVIGTTVYSKKKRTAKR